MKRTPINKAINQYNKNKDQKDLLAPQDHPAEQEKQDALAEMVGYKF